MELVPGATIAEKWRLDSRLGQGGMGEVWAATHVITRKAVALKFLRSQGRRVGEMRQRFLREARAATAVRHPNVVEVHDVFEVDDQPVMVMDLLRGETLGARLEREGRLPLKDALDVILPVLSAVGTAHACGVVHRDLKPENIFLAQEEPGRIEVKVVDFGIAKLMPTAPDSGDTGGLTGTGTMLGTPYYMAPEQGFGEKSIDHRADVWAIGAILYECLAGRRATRGDNLGQILKLLLTDGITPISLVVSGLPEEVGRLIDRMLARERDQRPADLREVLEILRPHASVTVRDFESPAPITPSTPPNMLDSGRVVVGSDAIDPNAPTGEAVSSDTTGALVSTGRRGKGKLPVLWVSLGSVLAVAAGIAVLVRRSSEPPSASASAETAPSGVPVGVRPAPEVVPTITAVPVISALASATRSKPAVTLRATPAQSSPTQRKRPPRREPVGLAEKPPF